MQHDILFCFSFQLKAIVPPLALELLKCIIPIIILCARVTSSQVCCCCNLNQRSRRRRKTNLFPVIRDGVLVICPGSILNASPQHTILTYAYNSYPHLTILPPDHSLSLLPFFSLSLLTKIRSSQTRPCILCVIYPPIYLLL